MAGASDSRPIAPRSAAELGCSGPHPFIDAMHFAPCLRDHDGGCPFLDEPQEGGKSAIPEWFHVFGPLNVSVPEDGRTLPRLCRRECRILGQAQKFLVRGAHIHPWLRCAFQGDTNLPAASGRKRPLDASHLAALPSAH